MRSCASGACSDVAVLLDTHTLLWYAADDPRLPARLRTLIADPGTPRFVSAASAWEIATKARLGKLEAGRLEADFVREVRAQGFRVLPIGAQDAQEAGSLAGAHGDPFDRMLAAQALRRDLTLVSNDAVLDQFGVTRLWA